VIVASEQKVPTLALSGTPHPITRVQDANDVEGILDFFKSHLPQNRRTRSGPIDLLLRGIDASSTLCGRIEFEFKQIFPRHPEMYSRIERIKTKNLLQQVLEQELNYRSGELVYSQEGLHQEVKRLMHDFTLLSYQMGSTLAPGIAFEKVEEGDFVCRADEMNNTTHYGLILRPCNRQEGLEDQRNTYHLIDSCLDFES
jgi:hypothetical protein